MALASAEEPVERRVFAALGLAFFASGAAALIDQTVWQRMLGIFAGSDAVTAAIVVGAFLLGLGIGALVAGLYSDRLSPRSAALAFAACEVGIGTFALLSKPFIYDFVAATLGPLVHSRALIFLVSFVGLLLPTFLMGCSLPLLARAAVRGLAGAARRIGLLYGLNTLGAGAGALIGGWWLAGTIGFAGALVVAAGLNASAAALALFVATRLPAGPTTKADATPTLGADRRLILGWSLLVFVSGFIIVGLEILWVRVLGAFLQSNAYAFSSILAAFLLADGLGIVIGASIVERVREPRTAFVLIQAAAVALAALTFLAIYSALTGLGLDAVIGADAGRHRGSGLVAALALVAVAVMPPSLLMGLSFPFVQKAVQRELATVGRRVGSVQLANIVGNALGGLAVGLVTLEWFGTIGTMLLLGGCALLILAVEFSSTATSRTPVAVGAAVLAVALLVLPGNERFWHAAHSVRPGDVAFAAEGRSGIALLRLREGRGPMFIGAFSQSDIPFASWHVLLGVLGPLVHPDPRDVLVIGVGSGGTPYTAGVRPETRSIRAVELVAPVFDVLQGYARANPASAVSSMFADPRYQFVVGDGRHDIFVGERRYDLIQADAIYSESSMSGMLYSREFFELARNALKENGIFVQWAPTPRTVSTFSAVFPHVVKVSPFAALIGSNQPIPFDADRFAQAVRRPDAVAYLARAGTDASILPAMVAGKPTVLTPDMPRSGDVNTDMYPRDEFYLTR